MKINYLRLLLICIGLVAFFVGFNNFIYQQKQRHSVEVTRYRGTLTGEYVCLPHADTTGPQTLECALGMKTESGSYYAIDLSAMSQSSPNLLVGDKFTATGTITPIELLSTDHWKKYNIEGIFLITDSLIKL